MQRVMIIAGEASGDLHAGKIVHHVRQQNPAIQFFGIGGEDMRAAGVETLVDSAELAVVGLIEVLAHRKVIFGALHQMEAILRNDPPDLLVLVDYPEFNLRLAKTAKQLGVKVLFYISPQVWAWRQKRVHTIRKRVDMMAVVFPFEEAFYRQHDVPVKFVGHPLVNELDIAHDLNKLKHEFRLDAKLKTIGLFPGSRRSEVKRLLPIILESAKALYKTRRDIQFILPVASTLNRAEIESHLSRYDLPIQLITGRSHEVIQVCDTIISVSGTVTLEIALFGVPVVVINKIAWLSYFIIKRMIKIPYIALCNIIAEERVVPELIQAAASPDNICRETIRFLDDDNYRDETRTKLLAIREKLGKEDGIENIAQLILDMI